jgi:hypothetical protein
MSMAGIDHKPELKLDGCDILPLMKSEEKKAYFPDGKERESMFWYFPVESHMAAAIRKGPWKLIENYGMYWGKGVKPGVALYRLYNDDGLVNDISENVNLAAQEPEICRAMLEELHAHLREHDVARPYKNPAVASADELKHKPRVLNMGSKDQHVWAEVEVGEGKNEIVEAFLLYTMNPKPFDSTGGHREEWFSVPATKTKGKVEAIMPPGATHGVFCMRDSENFLVTSEQKALELEASQDAVRGGARMSRQGAGRNFAYRPGLFALIELGKSALYSARRIGLNTAVLNSALVRAQSVYAMENADEKTNGDAIRFLRSSIRNLSGIPEAADPYINRFPKEPLF